MIVVLDKNGTEIKEGDTVQFSGNTFTVINGFLERTYVDASDSEYIERINVVSANPAQLEVI